MKYKFMLAVAFVMALFSSILTAFGMQDLFATAGMFFTEEKENAPDERQLNQGHRKIYNFNLAKGWGEVNGRTENL